MRPSQPSTPSRLPLVFACALASLALAAGCGGAGDPADVPPEPAQPEGGAASAEPVAPPDVGLAIEPVLWARFDRPYQDFRAEPVRALHAELAARLGEPLLFRIVPYVGRDPDSGDTLLKGETLEVYYQETEISLDALRRRADDLIGRVRAAFPDLDEGDSLVIHARLPEGRTVGDLEPELAEACGRNNSVRTGVRPVDYVAGEVYELYFALCDAPPVLDAQLQNPRQPILAENWTLEPAAP